MLRVNGLFGHIESNDKRSLILFGGFLLAFHLIAVVALFVPLAVADEAHAPIYGWGGYAVRYVPIVTLAAGLLFAFQMYWHVRFVKRQVDFRYIDNADEPRLCRIIEPLALTAGIPVPYVGLIDRPELNAFACGYSRKNAVLVVTRGLVDSLDDEELAAVLAHELMHIRNGDIRFMAAANTFIRNLGWLQKQNMLRIEDYRQVILMLLLPIFFPLLMVGGFLTQIAFRTGHLSRLLITSSREYIADAEAIRLTQNPAALVSALRKIEGRSSIPDLDPEQDAMMIDGATEGAYASHPTIAERIAALAAVTGSMTFISPSRKDTRPPHLRGFGRRGDAVQMPAELPTRSSRPAISALLRIGVDSDRNMFGLKRQTSLLVFGAIALFLVIHRSDLGSAPAMAAKFDIRPVKTIAAAGIQTNACYIGFIKGAVPQACKGDPMKMLEGEGQEGTILGAMSGVHKINRERDKASGMYEWPDGSFRSYAPDDVKVKQVAAQRCFHTDGYNVSDHGLGSAPHNSEVTLQKLVGDAEKIRTNVVFAFAGDEDGQLKTYFEQRKILLEISHRFYGETGLDAIQGAFARPGHKEVIALLGERLKDRAFVKPFTGIERAELKLLAEAPADFITCIARRRADRKAANGI